MWFCGYRTPFTSRSSDIHLKYFRNLRSAGQVVTQRGQKKRVATTLEKVDSCIPKVLAEKGCFTNEFYM